MCWTGPRSSLGLGSRQAEPAANAEAGSRRVIADSCDYSIACLSRILSTEAKLGHDAHGQNKQDIRSIHPTMVGSGVANPRPMSRRSTWCRHSCPCDRHVSARWKRWLARTSGGIGMLGTSTARQLRYESCKEKINAFVAITLAIQVIYSKGYNSFKC